MRIYRVTQTGAPEARHPLLDHPVCVSDLDRGIAWGLLTTPSMQNPVVVVSGQRVEEEIGCPRYLIRGTGEGAIRLGQEPQKALPLRQLIFLHSNNDIPAWLLAHHGKYPLDLLVVKSRPKNREHRPQRPEPAKGRYRFLNHNVWEDAVGVMQADDDEHEDAEGEEWLQAETQGEPQVPPDRGAIGLDKVCIDT